MSGGRGWGILEGMRSLHITLLCAVVALGAGWAAPARAQNGASPAAPAAVASQPAPDFLLYDQGGKPFRLSAQRGEKVLVVFYKGYY